MDELDTVIAKLDSRRPERVEAELRSWRQRFEARQWAEGDRGRLRPSLLRRTDGAALLYPGKVNEAHAEPETGKGFLGGLAAAEVLASGGRVVWLDFDFDPEGVVERTLAGGASPDELDRLFVHAIEEPLPLRVEANTHHLTSEADEVLEEIATLPELGLVVVDGYLAAAALHGLSPRDEVDVAAFTRLILWRLRSPSVAVLVLDHVVKDRESRGRFAHGSIHKLNVIDGASFSLKALAQPAPGKLGKVRLTVSKDRHGGVRATANRQGSEDVAAVMVVDSTGTEPVVTLEVAEPTDSWRPTGYMERVSRWLEGQAEPVSKNRIEAEVEGKAAYVRQALDALVEAGFVERRIDGDGARAPVLHHSTKPYREGA